MGLDYPTTKFLLENQSDGVDFTDFVSLGRQDLLVFPDQLKDLLSEYGRFCSDNQIRDFYTKSDQFAEPLIEHIGAERIDSIDFSEFEGATIVHDLNTEIPDEFHEKFTVVLDGGTLEHVFNFPIAIKNCMNITKTGGHVLSVTPCNNMVGHGFYQFSPELFYRIFSKENGFIVERMYICQAYTNSDYWFEVIDPHEVKSRVELQNTVPTYLLVRAKKIENISIFDSTPQQSDYASEWDNNPTKGQHEERLHFFKKQMEERENLKNRPGNRLKQLIPQKIKQLVRGYKAFHRLSGDPNPKFFKKKSTG